MAAGSLELRPLDADDGARAQRLLRTAFVDDANMRWCFLGDEPGYEERLAAYCEVGHAWHTACAFPVHAAYEADALAGVAYVMDAHAAPGDDVPSLMPALRERCGDRATDRFLAYNEAAEAEAPDAPALCVALLAVEPARQGHGIGSALLRWANARADADPDCRGVVLDTGNPRNLPFYGRHGFREVGQVTLDGLVEHVLWRDCVEEDADG